MKQKLSNYIAEKLLASGITDVFMITGGGAMHLDDALGHQEGLHCLYNHHEQACAMAAEAYARIHNKIAAVCVTTGPGGINAMNGVAGGFLDSIPMFVISGQVRYDTTARSTGLHLRAMGDQEYDITKSVANMTKYCEMVIDPMRIRFCVEKALYLAYNGRPGPTWLDIPLNVQAAMIETDDLIGFDPEDYEAGGTGWAAESASEIPEDTAGKGEFRAKLPARVTKETARAIIEKVRTSKRPVINAGNGIRIGAAHDVFMRVVEKLGKILGKMAVDVVLDALREHVSAPVAVLRRSGEKLLHKRQQRHQQMMRPVVVSRGQLAVQHIVQPLQPHGLLLCQRTDRRRLVRDKRVLAQSGYVQSAERQTEGRDRPVRPGRLIVHHAAVVDEQVAPPRVIRHSADKIPALAAPHQHDLHQIIMRVHDARMCRGLGVRPADRKQTRRTGQPERRLILLFHKALYHGFFVLFVLVLLLS